MSRYRKNGQLGDSIPYDKIVHIIIFKKPQFFDIEFVGKTSEYPVWHVWCPNPDTEKQLVRAFVRRTAALKNPIKIGFEVNCSFSSRISNK